MAGDSVAMPWGCGALELGIPAALAGKVFLAQPRPLTPLADPAGAVLAAVASPVGTAPLAQQLRSAPHVLLIVSDPTRSVAYPQWLPALLDFVRRHLPAGAQLTLLMACGTHDAPPSEATRSYLGVNDEVLLHDSRDEASLVHLGVSTRGTPLTVNRLAVECDLIIATGAVGYHYFAGFTGGVKALFPGLAGFASVVANHSLCLDLNQRLFAEGVAPGRLDGNPVHEDFLEVLPHLPPVFLINTVLAEDRHPAYFAAGGITAAHREACRFVDAHFRCELPRPADLLLLSAGGHPRDISLYQAHKALKHAEGALARRARVLFFAHCPEGMGHPYFDHWRELDYGATMALLRRGYQPVGHIALSLRLLAKRFDLNLVSELDAATAEAWGFTPVPPDKAAVKAAWMLARAKSPVVVTHGSSLLLAAGQ